MKKFKEIILNVVNSKDAPFITVCLSVLGGIMTVIRLGKHWPWLIVFVVFGLWSVHGVSRWLKEK